MTSQPYLCIASVLLVALGVCIASIIPANETFAPPTSENLQLSENGDSSRKQHEKKEGSARAPPTSAAASSPSIGEDAVLYKLPGEKGDSCILLSVDAIVEFKYSTTLNERMEKDTFIPSTATVNGDCSDDDDQQTFILRWKTFVLKFYFLKTPGGESWFVEKIELKYDSSDHHQFEHIKNPGRTYTLTTSSAKGLLFPTPVGKSYKCDEISVDLSNPKVTDTTATILLRQLKMEPFIFKNDFGPEFVCTPGGVGSYRSETAPLIAGSFLAAMCLGTITGYAIFRYFKIKKVQYDTME